MASERVKNHRIWAKSLKSWFEERFDTPICENCGSTNPPIDIAHRKKRFDIHTESEYRQAAMLCRPCHENFEYGTHDRMFDLVTEVINRR